MTEAVDLFVPGPAGDLSVRRRGDFKGSSAVVVLVQGANLSGQTGYDFSFPGGEDYSLMAALTAAGFATVTFAVRGYGLSTAPADAMGVRTDQAIEDLEAVLGWVASQTSTRPHLLGWSWGGRIVGRYAERAPEALDRLVLLDPALGGGDKVLPPPSDAWWSNSVEDYLRRMEPEFTDEDARQAFAALVMARDARAPNGIRMENAIGSIAVDPTRVRNPTLMIYGHAAARQNYMRGVAARGLFFENLATDDKALVIIPGGGDYGHIQRPRQRFQRVIASFLAA